MCGQKFRKERRGGEGMPEEPFLPYLLIKKREEGGSIRELWYDSTLARSDWRHKWVILGVLHDGVIGSKNHVLDT
jgi:hypothetical protein